MTKSYLKNNVGCVPRTEYYPMVRGTHPTTNASHVGWAKPRQRRTQQNLIVRWVSLRSTQPTFKSLCCVHVCGAVSDD